MPSPQSGGHIGHREFADTTGSTFRRLRTAHLLSGGAALYAIELERLSMVQRRRESRACLLLTIASNGRCPLPSTRCYRERGLPATRFDSPVLDSDRCCTLAAAGSMARAPHTPSASESRRN